MDIQNERIIECLKEKGLLVSFSENWENYHVCGNVQNDSRKIATGDLFAAVKGLHVDGFDLIGQVLLNGAAALLVQRLPVGVSVPWILVSDVRRAMGYVASILKHQPAENLKMVGVTGTNGKSTTSYMLRSIFEHCGMKCGLLGTVVYDDGSQSVLADRTTPESTEIQSFLADMVKNGCTACSMECSSIGIDQGRINGCLFNGVVFTNLSPEHLDYHNTMERYFEAKSALFGEYAKPGAVFSVNGDDPYGSRLAGRYPTSVTWGFLERNQLRAQDLQLSMDFSSFDLIFNEKSLGNVKIPLLGKFNAANALAAAALCLGMECSASDVIQGLNFMPQVPGRMERINLTNGVRVVIDYAHTAEALENLLSSLRPLVKGRMISVFGHGGDRFKQHRPLLGKVAASWADHIFVTMDNPRTEDPAEIAAEIVGGIKTSKRSVPYEVILPRDEAICRALSSCESGDVLVLSGKGPEPYLEINGVKHPYSDKGVVIQWATERGMLSQ